MSPTSSHLGEAVRPDGTLKDASEIEWAFDPDDSLPFPQASGDPSGDTSSTPAPAEAGLHRMTRTIHPARRFIEEDAECASTTGAHGQPAAKRKATSDDPDPDRRVSRKIVINLHDDSDEDVTSAPPTEVGEDDYEDLQAMADADNLVRFLSPSLSFFSHLQHRLRLPDPEKSVQPMYASSSAATKNTSIQQRENPWMAIGARSVGKHICSLPRFLIC